MQTRLGRTIILVEDYDTAYDFYHKHFFCSKLFDTTSPDGKRYLHIRFQNDDNIGIWFLQADTSEQKNKVGKQTAGQPTLVIYTDDIEGLYTHVTANDITILEELVSAPESKFFHCLDLYGNRLTVVQLSTN